MQPMRWRRVSMCPRFWPAVRASPFIHRSRRNAEEPDENAVWATDDALALSFTRRYALDWRYCAQWGKWLVWTGNRWQPDDTLLVTHLMRHICREAAIKRERAPAGRQARLEQHGEWRRTSRTQRTKTCRDVGRMGRRSVARQHARRCHRSAHRPTAAARPGRPDDQDHHGHAERRLSAVAGVPVRHYPR
jgi:hypothetical protein